MWRCVTTTHCRFCLQEFWQHTLCVNHVVEKSRRCHLLYQLYVQPCDDDQLQELHKKAADEDAVLRKKGWRSNKALKPVQRLVGPLESVCDTVGIDHKILLKGRPKIPV